MTLASEPSTPSTYYVEIPETWPRRYQAVDQAPAKGYRYASAPAFIVHSKLGGSFKKPQPFVVRGVGRDELLAQKIGNFAEPDCHENYKALYADGSWHTISFDYTTEGYRFVRTVRKAIELLTKLAREATKAQAKTAKAQRDFNDRGERCGSCPVCFGDYVVHQPSHIKGKSKMVHHGYQRPGIGYIVGDCHGVGFAPFEISCEGTKSWLAVLKNTLRLREEALATLDQRTEVSVVTGTKRVGKVRVPERKTLKRGENGFAGAIENLRYELTREIKSLQVDIVVYTKHVADWTPVAWPRKQSKAS
jgi:hypothetical protein